MKRSIALLLSLTLLLSLFTVNINASDSTTEYSAYSLLNDYEKEYYDAVLNLEPGTFKFSITYSPYIVLSKFNTINFTKIMNAILLDHPELFYYNGYNTRIWKSGSTKIAKVDYTIKVQEDAPYTADNVSQYNEAFLAKLSILEFNTLTRYDFIKSIHDYLCETVIYSENAASRYDAYGALVDNAAVCQGYAEAFKVICDYYGVPCVTIVGTGVDENGSGDHMWNALQMEDGKWYFIDVTWDDQGENTYYDFFLVGEDTVSENFSGYTFGESHIKDEVSYLPEIQFSETAYDSSGKFSGFSVPENSLIYNGEKIVVLSYFDSADNTVYYNGMKVKVNDYATNAVFTAPSGADNSYEDWRFALVGDCDGNGTADSNDYTVAVNKTLAEAEINTVYEIACDAVNDGVLDALDIAVLERAINGANTLISLK